MLLHDMYSKKKKKMYPIEKSKNKWQTRVIMLLIKFLKLSLKTRKNGKKNILQLFQ